MLERRRVEMARFEHVLKLWETYFATPSLPIRSRYFLLNGVVAHSDQAPPNHPVKASLQEPDW